MVQSCDSLCGARVFEKYERHVTHRDWWSHVTPGRITKNVLYYLWKAIIITCHAYSHFDSRIIYCVATREINRTLFGIGKFDDPSHQDMLQKLTLLFMEGYNMRIRTLTVHSLLQLWSVIPQAVDNLWKVVVNIKEVTFESLTWNIVLLGFSSKFACLYPVYVTNNYPNTNRI